MLWHISMFYFKKCYPVFLWPWTAPLEFESPVFTFSLWTAFNTPQFSDICFPIVALGIHIYFFSSAVLSSLEFKFKLRFWMLYSKKGFIKSRFWKGRGCPAPGTMNSLPSNRELLYCDGVQHGGRVRTVRGSGFKACPWTSACALGQIT